MTVFVSSIHLSDVDFLSKIENVSSIVFVFYYVIAAICLTIVWDFTSCTMHNIVAHFPIAGRSELFCHKCKSRLWGPMNIQGNTFCELQRAGKYVLSSDDGVRVGLID